MKTAIKGGVRAAAIACLVMMSQGFEQAVAVAIGPPCHGIKCRHHGDGTDVGVTRRQTESIVREKPPSDSRNSHPGSRALNYEYAVVTACPGDTIQAPNQFLCRAALTCPNDTVGPLSWIERRIIFSVGPPSGWTRVALTCFTDLVPTHRKLLTMQLLTAAWRHTAFAKPTVHIQPEGNTTLVTLPAYFAVQWPKKGFRPGQINTVTLLGHTVRIKPTLKSYDYHYGDGTGSGTTTSAGGPYPAGDIRHGYDNPGHYTTNVTITYGGQVSVDDSPWIDIPGQVALTGASQVLRVATARSRLVNN